MMIEGIMKRLGYYKIKFDDEGMVQHEVLDTLLSNGLFVIHEEDFDVVMLIDTARANCKDVFIDYVKKTDTQKFYIDKKMVLEK